MRYDARQCGKRGIRPLATPKPVNRSSPKVAYVIMPWISTHTQNLVMTTLGVSFPRMREFEYQSCLLGFFFGFFQRSIAKAPEPIFTHNTSNDAVPRKDVPLRG